MPRVCVQPCPGTHLSLAPIRRRRDSKAVCCSRQQVPSEVLDLGTPAPAARRVVGREQAHARRPADLDGDLSHGAHLLNACAAVQGAPEVPFELGIYLLCPH